EFREASWAAAAAGGTVPIDVGAVAFRSLAQVRDAAAARGFDWWTIAPFGLDEPGTPAEGGSLPPWEEPEEPSPVPEIAEDAGEPLTIPAQAVPLYQGDTARVVQDVKAWVSEGARVVLVFAGQGPAQRAAEVLRSAGFGVELADQLPQPPAAGAVVVTTGGLDHGLRLPGADLVVLTGDDLTGGRGAPARELAKMPSRRRTTIDPLELRAGDLVVHEQHGIGRYVELVRRTVNG